MTAPAPALQSVADEPRWYLAKTKRGLESVAKAALEAHKVGIVAYLPLRLVKDRKGRIFARPLLGNNLFFRCRPDPVCWQKVYTTHGIELVYNSGGNPMYVRDDVVERIRAEQDIAGMIRIRSRKERLAGKFAIGQTVAINGGAFAGLNAIFEHHDLDTNRVSILLRFMGRDTRVQLEADFLS